MTTKSEKELVLAPGSNGAVTGEEEGILPALDDMTPREIVVELDKYIVGQTAAKRAGTHSTQGALTASTSQT